MPKKLKIKQADGKVSYYDYILGSQEDNHVSEVFITLNQVQVCISISWFGVSADFIDGRCLVTNITPATLFPNTARIKKKHLKRILKILIDTNFEGKMYSAEQMEATYLKWKESQQ